MYVREPLETHRSGGFTSILFGWFAYTICDGTCMSTNWGELWVWAGKTWSESAQGECKAKHKEFYHCPVRSIYGCHCLHAWLHNPSYFAGEAQLYQIYSWFVWLNPVLWCIYAVSACPYIDTLPCHGMTAYVLTYHCAMATLVIGGRRFVCAHDLLAAKSWAPAELTDYLCWTKG